MKCTKDYTNGEVTVEWHSERCIHSATCAKGLPDVFKVYVRPWINMDAADTEEIVGQVKQCPSGALTYFMNNKNKR